MIREHVFSDRPDPDEDFRWRSREVSRIEGLSDAVFGFAVTLLVVSLEVPRTFDDLVRMMAGFPAFAVSFGLLVVIWHAQYKFFRRYGLEDTRTLVLNVALLFVVLFYIYPLKFLFSTLVSSVLGLRANWGDAGGPVTPTIQNAQWPALMVVYAVGYIAIYGIFALLYHHAYTQRTPLDLDPLETLETRFSVIEQATMVCVALTSIAITLTLAYGLRWHPGISAGFGGWAYGLIWPAQVLISRARKRRRKSLLTTTGPVPAGLVEPTQPIAGEAAGH